MRAIFFLWMIVLFPLAVLAQERALPKVDFTALQGKKLKQATRLHRRAMAFWKWDSEPKKALREFRKLEKMVPKNGGLALLMAECHWAAQDAEQYLAYLTKASELEGQPAQQQALLALAKWAHLNGKWENAQQQFQSLQEGYQWDSLQAKEIEHLKITCENGKRLNALPPQRIFVDNMGKALNATADDYKAVALPNGKSLLFSSRRKGSTGASITENQFYEDIYQATYDGRNWRRPSNIGAPLNEAGHDGVLSSHPPKKMLLIYKGRNNGDLFFSRYADGQWQKPQPLPETINSPHRETSACLSADGNVLFFTSDRPSSNGGMDIFISRKTGKGWSEAKNAGAEVNTVFHEEGVTLSPDGKWLYFSSEGHSSVGGFDLFRAAWDGEKLGEVQQLAAEVNSPANELQLSFQSEKIAWLSADRLDGEGGYDLWQVQFLGGEVTWPLSAWQWASLPDQHENVWLDSLVLALAGGTQTEGDTLELQQVTDETEMMQALQDIHFLVGSVVLTSKAKAVLRSVVGLLQQQASWGLEINGHTDNVGDAADNLALSRERAQTVANYLISKGIAAERLYTNGFGDTQPIASNDTATGREKNRRIAFKLLKEAGK